MYMGDSDTSRVVSGGLQQYMNKHIESKSQPNMNVSSSSTTNDSGSKCMFQNLPVNVRIHIFSYLKVYDLCRIARVCQLVLSGSG
ncbi:hypothetical protein ScPMuIL_006240 [Solemya velum]